MWGTLRLAPMMKHFIISPLLHIALVWEMVVDILHTQSTFNYLCMMPQSQKCTCSLRSNFDLENDKSNH